MSREKRREREGMRSLSDTIPIDLSLLIRLPIEDIRVSPFPKEIERQWKEENGIISVQMRHFYCLRDCADKQDAAAQKCDDDLAAIPTPGCK